MSLKGRLSKTRLFIALAGLVAVGGAGGYVLYSGMLSGAHVEGESAQPSGVACTTSDFIKLNRGGQRWLRKYIRTDSADGLERVRTALRIAGVLAKAEKADLYQVVVLDDAGPQGRANLRGAAIGAEVLFAPDPTRLPGMDQPFIARYATGKANTVGLFYGERVELSSDDIRATMTAITDRSDCETLVADASAPEEGEGVPVHGKAAGAHGATADAGHGEAQAEGHGEAPAEAHGEGHDAPAPEGGHDAAPEGGHDAAASTETDAGKTGGWMSSVMGMIPGLGGATDTAGPQEHAATGADAPGLLTRVAHMIPGVGGLLGDDPAAADETAHQPAPATQAADHSAPAPSGPDDGHAGAPADAAGHEAVTVSEQADPPAADSAAAEAEASHGVAAEETGATH